MEEIERQEPVRGPTVESDVIVPGLQAFMLCCVLFVLMLAAGRYLWPAVHWMAWGLLALVSFFLLLVNQMNNARDTQFIWTIERKLDLDLDRDGMVGEPYTPLMQLNPGNGINERRQLFEDFVRGCAVDTSLGTWERRIGRDNWSHWRDTLMVAGWAEWNNPDARQQGWRLTAPPDEILAYVWQ